MCVRVCVSVSRTNVDVISEVDLIPLSNKDTGRLMTTPVLLWLPRLFMLMRDLILNSFLYTSQWSSLQPNLSQILTDLTETQKKND